MLQFAERFSGSFWARHDGLHGVALQSVAHFGFSVKPLKARKAYTGRIMKPAVLLVPAFSVALLAADPSQPLFWSADQQKNFDKQALSKLNADRHLGTERLLDSAFVAFRNGSGEAEIHVKLADLLLIRSGEGTVLVGGKIVDGKPTGPDEIRGKSIEGGTRYPIAAGDILYVPANTVHQFLIGPGQSFTAMVVKITPKP
jgi:mannose-6-phosphate isomerase-like protein (cupin superfamily)